ncbi:MAG: DUF1800 family protein [Alphaproteobacteria bacterium]
MHFSLRIGLGTDSTHSKLQSVEDALRQYRQPAQFVGVRSISSMNPVVEPWPEDMLFSLDERVAATRYDRKTRDKTDESTTMSREEKDEVYRELKRKEHRHIDRLQLFHQAVYGADPARQRLIHFWLNHFTIGSNGPADFMIGHVIHDTIAKGIAGKFADLAYDITRHPGMLTYLDNVYNIGEKSLRARNAGRNQQIGLNDNLARELMELHTTSPSIGYSEEDIRQAAKILAAWGDIFDNPNTVRNFKEARIKDFHLAYFKDKAEPGKKTVLGTEYPDGIEALKMLVDDLANSDHTARFLSRKLCVHFIADEPSKEDLDHVFTAWKDSGGDLNVVHKALLKRAAQSTQPKFQWPFTWLVTVLRMSRANLVQGFDNLHQEIMRHRGEYRAGALAREIGQDFWSRRQPDGFSLQSADWISPEHFERRMRLAAMIHDHGKPSLLADDLMDLLEVSQATRTLVGKGRTNQDRFVLLTCSSEFMGA